MRQYGGVEKGPRKVHGFVHGHGYLPKYTACSEENQSEREISYKRFEQFHGHKPYWQFAIF